MGSACCCAASPRSAACAAPGSTPSATPPSAASERALIAWYEALLERCRRRREALARWPEILAAPMEIRGYGPVKEAAIARVRTAVPL